MSYKNTQKGSMGIVVAILAVILIGGGMLYYNRVSKSEHAMDEHGMMNEHGMMGGDMMKGMKGVVFKDGKIMLEVDKKLSPLTGDYTFDTGIIVTQSGLATKKDGTTIQLKDSESIWNDGTVMKAGESMMMDDKMMGGEGSGAMVKGGEKMMGRGGHDAAAAKAGTYEPYAPEKIVKAETGKVVLFFHASWCSTCRALTEDIKSHLDAIPENVTILDVDYDTSAALKQKYKVTTQHTLVQIDAKGEQIKQWKGSPTLADMLAHIQ